MHISTKKLAIICIAVLEAINLATFKVDGMVMSGVVGAIAAIAGYRMGEKKRRRK